MESQLHFHHTTYCNCSYLVNCVHEYFTATDSHLQISQHQASLKHENVAVSYHSYTTLLSQNNLQLHIKYYFQIHFTVFNQSYVIAQKQTTAGLLGTATHESIIATN